ncbi:DEAD/DEAH box helicase [Alteromonas hispanica]|uniref:DEAD/DEAH box helicase family protein n=1 Tax=Alteromonas hispanica TaxID=315421 RepID=A0A6L9MVI1_9ALTE|nr:DEAD/DEAH box helicase [Alteromonas hispanica]NDW22136.1 DEAD/DEAH box helicase family protein [Alteromonas hispanica]
MPINFKKRTPNKGAERKTHPREIYDTLDRHANKGPLRVPVQNTILDEWFSDRKDQRDVILKLPTGEGKTLIGLLILQSKINQKKGSCLYVCPNKYLAAQVRIQADEFGIQHCDITAHGLPEDFINGEKILITHAQTIFNGRSANFGIGRDSVEVENILLDDAHSCIEAIKSASKFKIPRSSDCYHELLQLFGESLAGQGAGTFADIQNESRNAILAVPYWEWEAKQDEVVQVLSKYNKSKDKHVWFVWELLKNNLSNCVAAFSGMELEISPRLLPIEMFGTFDKASHRVFMSATISNDSFFIRDLGLKREVIENPLTFEKKWSGEKMILIPSLIDGTLTREEIINWIGQWGETNYGVVAITPSNWHRKIWESIGAQAVDKTNLITEVEKLKQGKFPHPLVMAAKYDGIDLPDNMCRILVLDSLPITETISEKYLEQCVPNSTFTQIKTAQTIEQGLGRAVRGEKDYCVVLVLGNDLVKQIRFKGSRPFLSPQTRKQIDIGLDLAKFAREDMDESKGYIHMLLSVINQGLGRDESWKEFYVESMNAINLDDGRSTRTSDEMLIQERKAEIYFSDGNYDKAVEAIQSLLDHHADKISKDEKGWYLQEMSRFLYAKNRVDGMAMQVNAHRTNKRLFLPPDGYQVTKIDLRAHERLSNIKSFIGEYADFEDFLVYMDEVFSRLEFGIKAEKFEKAIDELGKLLGFNTEMPDSNWKSGPDNLWAIKDGEYLFIECKSEVLLTRAEIQKEETGQFNNNIAWFNRFYPGAKVSYTIAIPTKKVKANTGFNEPVSVLRQRGLKKLVRNARSFVLGFKNSDLKGLSDEMLHQSIAQHKLSSDLLVEEYFEPVQYI